MSDGDYTNTYWGDKGRCQKEYDVVSKLIPRAGKVSDGNGKNKCLERLRKAANAYYDVYNNGCGNRNADIRYFLKVGIRKASADSLAQDTIDTMDAQMDKIIMDAYSEQRTLGNIEPIGQLGLTT
jgi:hypothetical protein